MPNNYVLLEKITVGATGASSVTFANIPQTGYTDLVVKVSARGTQAVPYATFRIDFNGITTGYSLKQLYGSGSAAVSDGNTISIANDAVGATATANTFSNNEFYIPNYTSGNFKSVSLDGVTENNATEAYTELYAGLWSNTAAINSITMTATSSTVFAANSTFYLYGVAKLGTTPAIAPKASGGDIVMTDGTYWYHAFRSSGTFTPAVGLSCDLLQIAGGGGGGSNGAGGGGAGGLLAFTSQFLSPTNYTVTVGAGGAGGSGANGTSGGNSQFGALTASAGGGGGGQIVGNGISGGSGGGGGTGYSFDGVTATPPGVGGVSSPSGQGSAGGRGYALQTSTPANIRGAGGGGATFAGSDATDSVAGVGGTGSSAYSSWATATGTGVSGVFAGGGGGGGGTAYGVAGGGTGGGGAGGAGSTASVAGTANTGSGGGGGGNPSTTGAAGGSGLVIVRYTVA